MFELIVVELKDMYARCIYFLNRDVSSFLKDKRGQGTTEYAILVGVLVVIAIFSIITFKDKVQELWDQIASGISAL